MTVTVGDDCDADVRRVEDENCCRKERRKKGERITSDFLKGGKSEGKKKLEDPSEGEREKRERELSRECNKKRRGEHVICE